MTMSFVVDEMLGHVARWLRIIGYDTKFVNKISDSDLLQLAKEEGRTLITSDRELSLKARKNGIEVIFIASGNLLDVLSHIAANFSIPMEPRLLRCTVCNGNLKLWRGEPLNVSYPIPKESKDLWVCDHCGKVYWKGTHWVNICNFLERVSEEAYRLKTADGKTGL